MLALPRPLRLELLDFLDDHREHRLVALEIELLRHNLLNLSVLLLDWYFLRDGLFHRRLPSHLLLFEERFIVFLCFCTDPVVEGVLEKCQFVIKLFEELDYVAECLLDEGLNVGPERMVLRYE